MFYKPPQLKHVKEEISLWSVFYMCIHVIVWFYFAGD